MSSPLPTNKSPLSELERFAAVELIAVDIDGTLATAQGQEVTDLVKAAVKSLTHYGVVVTVATGRAMAGARDTIFGLNGRLGPAIVYNGAVVVDLKNGEVLSRTAISEVSVAKVGDLAVRHGASMWAYDCRESPFGDVDTQTNGIQEVVNARASQPGPDVELNGLSVNWHDSRWVSEPAVAILLSNAGDEDLLSALSSVPNISVTSSTPEFIEIRPTGTNKASALALLAQRRELGQQQVLAIGDNHNDIEMLEWAGTSVAVANATESARDSATYLSAQPDARGVVETLRLVTSAKRFSRGYAFAIGDEKVPKT